MQEKFFLHFKTRSIQAINFFKQDVGAFYARILVYGSRQHKTEPYLLKVLENQTKNGLKKGKNQNKIGFSAASSFHPLAINYCKNINSAFEFME